MSEIKLPKFMASTGHDVPIGRILPDSVTEDLGFWLYGITPEQAEQVVKALKSARQWLYSNDYAEDNDYEEFDDALAIFLGPGGGE